MLTIMRGVKGFDDAVIYPDGTAMPLADLLLVHRNFTIRDDVRRIEYIPGVRLSFFTDQGQFGPDFHFEGTWPVGDLLIDKQAEHAAAIAAEKATQAAQEPPAPVVDTRTLLIQAIDDYLTGPLPESTGTLRTVLLRLKELLAVLLLMLIPTWAHALDHFSNVAQDQNGRAVSGATITVYQAGTTTLAALYSDNGTTVKNNPFTTSLDGVYDFYAASGRYDITIKKTGYTSIYWDASKMKGLTLFDPQQHVVPFGATLPSTPETGAFFVLTGDSGNCVEGSGSSATLCRWSGLAWNPIGGGGTSAAGLNNNFLIQNEITAATSATPLIVGNGTQKGKQYGDPTKGFVIEPVPLADTVWRCWTNFNCLVRDEGSNSTIFTISPSAGSKNGVYQFGVNFKPIGSVYVPLSARAAATMTETNLLTNQPKRSWGQNGDNDTDAFDFHIPVTAKMAGMTTLTVTLTGASTNATPSGNIVYTCAVRSYRPGIDTYAAHDTTGEQTVTLTPATQYRPVSSTSPSITINGTVATGAELIGSCEANSAGTTSAQMTNWFLSGDVLVQFLVNSWSD